VRASSCSVCFALLVASPRIARAEPQFNLALLPGVALASDRPRVAFSGRAHADVILGRTSSSSWGLGPALDVGTFAFRDLRLMPALSLQLPTDPVSVVLSLGPLWRFTPASDLGASFHVFVGSRAYNHFSHYSPALGLDLSLEALRGPTPNYFAALTAHVDLEWLSLPFVIAVSWLRGPTR
jgi:hypothetical protein